MLSFQDLLKALDRLGKRHIPAGKARKLPCHEERLGQESLNFSGSRNDQLVFLGKLVHYQHGDDVLKLLISLEHLLDAAGHLVMFLAHDTRIQDSRGGLKRIHGRIDT